MPFAKEKAQQLVNTAESKYYDCHKTSEDNNSITFTCTHYDNGKHTITITGTEPEV